MDAMTIAKARVEAEDRKARAVRIDKYEREIREALRHLSKPEIELSDSGAKILTFDLRNHDEAHRVREALIELGCQCSDIVAKDGSWVNGVGYTRYFAMEVIEHSPDDIERP